MPAHNTGCRDVPGPWHRGRIFGNSRRRSFRYDRRDGRHRSAAVTGNPAADGVGPWARLGGLFAGRLPQTIVRQRLERHEAMFLR